MENAQLQQAESTAPNRDNFFDAPRFSPRQRRALEALWNGARMRESLDRIAGCSNAPQLVSDLRDKGIDIDCTLVDSVDRDGRPCKPGRYELTDKGRDALQRWGWALATGGNDGERSQ